MTAAFWTGLVGAFVTLAGSVGAWIVGRRRNTAETGKISAERDHFEALADEAQARAMQSITAAATGLVIPLQSQVLDLTARVERLQTTLDAQRKENFQLRTEVERLTAENTNLHKEVEALRTEVATLRADDVGELRAEVTQLRADTMGSAA